MEQIFNELIVMNYFWYMIPWVVIGLLLIILGIKCKDEDPFQYGCIFILIGIIPGMNMIIMIVVGILLLAVILSGCTQLLGKYLFEIFTGR